MTVGRSGARPWLHCHAFWRDAEGRRKGGHILPDESWIWEPIEASIWFLDGASFDVVPNPETGFSLFEPIATRDMPCSMSDPFAMSVRPNEDLCTAIESECRSRGVRHARILGGVGSLVGAKFDDGREVVPFVTEVFVREGTVSAASDEERVARIDASLVDHLGGVSQGRLQRGDNPVLVTFELVVQPVEHLNEVA